MSADDPRDPTDPDGTDEIEPADLRAEFDRQRNGTTRPASDGEDLVDLLSAAFDTDNRTRVYVALRREPNSTVEELTEATGLYPTAVERVLSDLREEGVVESRTVAGNGETKYTAIAPQETVDVVLGRVREAIDDRFGVDRSRSRERTPPERTTDPVTIPVERDEGGGIDTDDTVGAGSDVDTDLGDDPDE